MLLAAVAMVVVATLVELKRVSMLTEDGASNSKDPRGSEETRKYLRLNVRLVKGT